MSKRLIVGGVLAAAACLTVTRPARAQVAQEAQHLVSLAPEDTATAPAPADTLPRLPRFRNRADSLTSVRVRVAAARDTAMRVLVSVADRQLLVMRGADTLRQAPVAVGMGRLLSYAGRRWVFATPRGVRVVRSKRAEPLWRPPDWLYAEVAREYHLKLAHITRERPVTLRDGRKLVVRDSLVGILLDDGFAPLPVDEHIVFDSTLYVPPLATLNRRIDGELGRYQLDLGDGYLLHGTPREETIGTASTHGCVRLKDEDLEWLYENVPVGTKVYIY